MQTPASYRVSLSGWFNIYKEYSLSEMAILSHFDPNMLFFGTESHRSTVDSNQMPSKW
jgi:hypothetical protein